MTLPARPFLQSDTHGIVLRSGNRIYQTSNDLGWTSVFVSEQREQPFAAEVSAASAHLIVIHLGGPVIVHGAIQGHDVRKAVRPGGLFLWPAGSAFKIELEAAVDTLHLYLHNDVIDEVADSLGCYGIGTSFEPILGGSDPLIEQLALEVSAAARPGGAMASLHVDQLALSIAGRLIRKNGGARPTQATRHGFGKHKLRMVTDYVEDALDMELSLKDLSTLAAMSITHFTRQFRAVMGLSAHQYVVQRRIERAKYLLGRTQEPIAQIAHGCGFSHQEHLSGMFRRHVGETPAQYRRCRRGMARP